MAKTTLYTWGYNAKGQTSHNSGLLQDARTWRCQHQPQPVFTNKLSSRTDIPFLIVDVDCGIEHTAAVTSSGHLFTWGANEYGQLGDGTENDSRNPKRVERLRREIVTSVACGSYCTAAISDSRNPKEDSDVTQEGRLWVWGQNQNRNLPRLFHGAFSPKTVVKQVACGSTHSAAVSIHGTLQCWGYNEHGQLGRGYSCDGLQEAQIVTSFIQHLDDPPVQIRIASVSCGDYHTAAIAEGSGDLYTWGWGGTGQLGHRVLQSDGKEVLPRRVVALEGVPVCQVACGRTHTCAITQKGGLYMWGGGKEGQLGLGASRRQLALAAPRSSLDHPICQLPILVMPHGVRRVACGQSHTLASMADGALLGWGYNSCGQAATGRLAYAWQPTPIDWCVGEVLQLAAGGGHSAVITQARNLKETCELNVAEQLFASTAASRILDSVPRILDVALRNSSDSLARLCQLISDEILSGSDPDIDEDEEQRRVPRAIRSVS